MWWCDEGDSVLAAGEYDSDVELLRRRYGLAGCAAAGGCGRLVPAPWGWSADAVRQFEGAGVDSTLLPTTAQVERMRMLSHRRSSIILLRSMGRDDLLPLETADPDEVVRMERETPGCYVKSPWSCSGRGVFCARGLASATLRTKAAGIIHRQGSVMVERGMDRVLDCAALFSARDGRVVWEGVSVFRTLGEGSYGGNLVAPQSRLLEEMTRYVAPDMLDAVIEAQRHALTGLVGADYEGWLGIDMMVCRTRQGGFTLHPCVELNLRMTMGVVAMKVSERLGVTHPRLLGWERVGEAGGRAPIAEGAELLLPPRDGFRLMLSSPTL